MINYDNKSETAHAETERKNFCTQNDGDCESCSLVNHGRDCRNNPVEEQKETQKTQRVQKLPYRQFSFEARRAETMILVDAGHTDYWQGYKRGLRRAFHGERFGTVAEHVQWLRSVYGEGYRDGLRGVPDTGKIHQKLNADSWVQSGNPLIIKNNKISSVPPGSVW